MRHVSSNIVGTVIFKYWYKKINEVYKYAYIKCYHEKIITKPQFSDKNINS